MKKFNRITPEGTKDSLFQECIVRRRVEHKIKGVFRSKGYNEVITPGLEYYDVFDLEEVGIPQYEMYKSTDNKGRLVVFRPDLTLPIARLVATRLQNHVGPMRLYYNQTIYRNRPDMTGRSDESTQAGIELMGAGGLRADLEVIVTAVQALRTCGITFRLELGHAGLFSIFAEQLGLAPEALEEIRCIIESKNYAALGGVLQKLPNSKYREAMENLPRWFGGQEVFDQVAYYCDDPRAKSILDYLRHLYTSLNALGLGEQLMVDLGLVQRNSYYTGVVFCAYVEGHGAAVLTGGRYDKLLAQFNRPMPAVGFGIDVDVLTTLLLQEQPLTVPDMLVYGESGFELAAQMRLSQLANEGCVCENALCETLVEAMAQAQTRGILRLLVVGETEKEISL